MKWSAVLWACASVGCVPLHPTVREARSGVVLDAQTRRPVVGATVRVESYRVATPPGYGGGVTLVESIDIMTDASGRWSVRSAHEWTIGILAADGLPLYSDVYCVSADGYADEVRNPNAGWFEREPSRDGKINAQDMETVLLLARRTPQSDPAPSSPGTKRSCIGRAAAQQAVAADGASPRR